MHEGHRSRLMGKIKEGGMLYEHELMEILLFYAVPRKDVNALAHSLISRFGGVRGVLSASVDELASVEGVGANVAKYIFCLARLSERGGNCASFARLPNREEFRKFLSVRESTGADLELFLLDKDGKVKRVYALSAENGKSVRTQEIIKAVSAFKPYGLFAARIGGEEGAKPSRSDDDAAEMISEACKLCGVRFYDYCVVSAGKDIFSYFVADRSVFSPTYGKVR